MKEIKEYVLIDIIKIMVMPSANTFQAIDLYEMKSYEYALVRS